MLKRCIHINGTTLENPSQQLYKINIDLRRNDPSKILAYVLSLPVGDQIMTAKLFNGARWVTIFILRPCVNKPDRIIHSLNIYRIRSNFKIFKPVEPVSLPDQKTFAGVVQAWPMKTHICIFLVSFNVCAQTFEETLQETVRLFEKAAVTDQKIYACDKLSSIALRWPDEWVGHYYTAYSKVVVSYMLDDDEKRELLLDQAGES